MTEQRPITPPPGLVLNLWAIYHQASIDDVLSAWTASVNAAYRAGADMELEEVLVEMKTMYFSKFFRDKLRAKRRPKPPSLKEQALLAIDNAVADGRLSSDVSRIVRLAIEALPQ